MSKAMQCILDLQRVLDEQRKELTALRATVGAARALVDEQADDEGLWFEAHYISEAILQQALRKLHEVIEGKSQEECALAAATNSQKKE